MVYGSASRISTSQASTPVILTAPSMPGRPGQCSLSVPSLPELVEAHALQLLHELDQVADHHGPHLHALLVAGLGRVPHHAAARDAGRAREPLHRARGGEVEVAAAEAGHVLAGR